MTINSLSPIQSTPVCGLGVQTYNVTAAGNYVCAPNYTIPHISAGSSADSSVTEGGSELEILVKLNGDTVLTLNNPSPTQPSLSGSVSMLCEAGDVITVEPSSEADVDQGLNVIKGIINVYLGV